MDKRSGDGVSSGTYLRAAQDLSDFHVDQLQERAQGYSLLLVPTGSGQSPNRTCFFASLLLHFSSIWLLASLLFPAGLTEMRLNLFSLVPFNCFGASSTFC
jgi:hypothetical protein